MNKEEIIKETETLGFKKFISEIKYALFGHNFTAVEDFCQEESK